MKVISLRGPENSGKSHTINTVYSYLIREGFTQVPDNYRDLGNFQRDKDFTDILSKDKLIIGIVGLGDYQKGINRLQRLIDNLFKQGCMVVICASRNNAVFDNMVTVFGNYVFIDKTMSTGNSNNRIVNAYDAQQIVNHI